MQYNPTSCTRCVGDRKICSYCTGGKLIKHGRSASGKTRFKCRHCGRTQVASYSYQAYGPQLNEQIIQFIKEGLGIRSIARILKIAITTLLRRIIFLARQVKQPSLLKGQTYEVDEIRTFIKRKDRQVWIVCALDRKTRSIISFNIGSRTNKTLNVVLQTLILSNARSIYTDGLVNYKHLLAPGIHKTDSFGTNYIERNNLTLRTHLKRLNRRSICFSKSIIMLRACLQIYFFS